MSQMGRFLITSGPGAGILTLTGNSGGPVPPDGSNNVNVVGGIDITVTGNPGTSTLTIDLDGNVPDTFTTDAGNAIPVLSVLNILGGTNISTSGAGNTVTIDFTGSLIYPWTQITATGPTAMSVNNGYIANNGALVQLTLPAVAALGDTIRVTGKGAGGWRIGQNVGQTIYFGNQTSTPGAGGRLDSNAQRDTVELVCITANTEWNVISSIGNITVV